MYIFFGTQLFYTKRITQHFILSIMTLNKLRISPVLSFFLIFSLVLAFNSNPVFAQDSPTIQDKPTETKSSESKPLKKAKKAKKAKTGENYIRVVRDAKAKKASLDTSIQHFEGENGVSVDLIGAVHVGEKTYYTKLNDIFKLYDAVLYEVVAEEGTRPSKQERNAKHIPSVIGAGQQAFAKMLGLVHQLEYIDYQPQNMVHADMSPQEFAQASKAREDGFTAWYLRSVGYSMGKTDTNGSDAKVLLALFSKDRKKALKSAMAEQFIDMDGQTDALKGTSKGTSIISDRNDKVLKKLSEILQSNKQKKIAIFYGAAHLPDFADKLEKNFKLAPKSITWIPAWNF